MNFVLVIDGKYTTGKTTFRDIRHVTFPLVNSELKENERGRYIEVDGNPVKGYPKRNFKVFVDSEQSFALVDALDDADDLDLSIVRVPQAPKQPEPIILNGEDDYDVKKRIRERFFIMTQLAWAAANGDIKSLVISGPPGVGKSHEVIAALEQENDVAFVANALIGNDKTIRHGNDPVPHVEIKPRTRYGVVGGRVSAAGLYDLLWKYSEERSVLVLDDCDVFSDETSLDLLKAALSQDKKRTLSWKTRSNMHRESPDSFDFKGSVIFITNLDFDNPKVKGTSLAPHIEAILSRVYYLDLTLHSLRERYLRIEQVCVDDCLLNSMELDEQQIDEVMAFFKDHINNFRDVSIRTVQKIGTLRKMEGVDWRKMAAVTTMKSSALSSMEF